MVGTIKRAVVLDGQNSRWLFVAFRLIAPEPFVRCPCELFITPARHQRQHAYWEFPCCCCLETCCPDTFSYRR